MKYGQNIVAIVLSSTALVLCYMFLWRLSQIEQSISILKTHATPTFTASQFSNVQSHLNNSVKLFSVLVTTLFTCLSVVLGIVGFGWIRSISERASTVLEKQIQDARKEQQKQIEIYIKDQNDLGLNFANTAITTAESLQNINEFNYVFQTLMGLSNYKHYGYKSDRKEQTNEIILGQLKILNLQITSVSVSNQPTRNLIWGYLSQLTSIRDIEITNQINILRSKIDGQ